MRKDLKKSLLYHLRSLLQWVKRVLIQDESKPALPFGVDHMDVLDLGCGRGWDLSKWKEAGKRFRIGRYVGVDINQPLLDGAIETYRNNREVQRALGEAVTLACADLTGADLQADQVPVWAAYNRQQGWQKTVLFDQADDDFDGEWVLLKRVGGEIFYYY